MYIGRIVTVALTATGHLCAGYRVSSRSFPNRQAVPGDGAVRIVPREGYEGDIQKNPYIAYNCLRIVADGQVAVASNGSHTDPIAEKIALGLPVRDALALSLLAMDYEKDQYNTPRIAAVADRRDGGGWLASVREDGLAVRKMPLSSGRCFYVATYEENRIVDEHGDAFDVETAEQACERLLWGGVFAERTNPVSSVAALAMDYGFDVATLDAGDHA